MTSAVVLLTSCSTSVGGSAADDVGSPAVDASVPLDLSTITDDVTMSDSAPLDATAPDVTFAELAPSSDAVAAVDGAHADLPLLDATSDAPEASAPACPAGQLCPTAFPFSHEGNTATLPQGTFHTYSCKPSADESGPEQVYRVEVTTAGFLSAAVTDDATVDVDVHVLSALDEASCVARGDKHARADVTPGTWFVVVDTYVSGGKALAGSYQVDIGFVVPSAGACELQTGVMKRVNDGGQWLAMPATGPIVLEAHLVTADEPPPYPTTSTEELAAHYTLSQSVTGFVMHRSQVWAPLEGGSFYGAGIFSPTTFPTLEESWYVNMYWTKESRPKPGTRMILRLPGSTRAVVVSAGHETGPGNLAHIGGTPEETHFYLGSGHLTPMQLGIAVDQALPFGPRTCD